MLTILWKYYNLVLRYGIDTFSPKVRLYNKQKYPRWFSNDIRALVADKRMFHYLYKQTQILSYFVKFFVLRSKRKALSRTCYRAFLPNIELKLNQNIKAFWNYVNTIKNSLDYPNVMHLNESYSVIRWKY